MGSNLLRTPRVGLAASRARLYTGPRPVSNVVTPANLLRQLLLGIEVLGHDPEAVLANMGLAGDQLEELDGAGALSQAGTFWDAAVTATGDAHIGLSIAELVRPENFDLLGYVARHSETLGDGLARVTQYGALIGAPGRISMDVDGPTASLTFGSPTDGPPHRQSVEFIFRALQQMAERLSGESAPSGHIEFRHPRPPSVERLESIFGPDLRFDQPHNRMVFESMYLKLPVRGHDPQLRKILERQARDLIEQFDESSSIVRTVTELVTKELATGNPNSDHVASLLGVSVRTMSRHLKEAGTSYQALLDNVRFQLASRYLSRTRVDIGEVAFLLGFADTSSFNRAFKRWSGETPSAYRAKVRAEGT